MGPIRVRRLGCASALDIVSGAVGLFTILIVETIKDKSAHKAREDDKGHRIVLVNTVLEYLAGGCN